VKSNNGRKHGFFFGEKPDEAILIKSPDIHDLQTGRKVQRAHSNSTPTIRNVITKICEERDYKTSDVVVMARTPELEYQEKE
jgi:cupin superfamily acireductone dioxygenase involved in methionine salvage